MSLLINDGFTLDGLIQATPGLHEAVRFKYRPALPERVAAYFLEKSSATAKPLAAEIKLLKEQMVEWDASDGTTPLPLDDRIFRRVYYPALQVLVQHVIGYSATDWTNREGN